MALSEHQRYYAAQRAAGLCGATGCKERSVKSLCQYHNDLNKQRMRDRYAYGKANRVCVYCNRQRETKAVLCNKCRSGQKKWLDSLVKEGRCLRCQEKKKLGTHVYCRKCRKFYSNMEKKRKKAARFLKLCVQCLRSPSVGRRWHCRPCLDKINNNLRAKRETARATKTCIECGAPSDGKILRCRPCADKYNAYYLKWKRKRKHK